MQPMNFGIDHNLIMQGKQADLGNALAQGLAAGGTMADQQYTGAYRAALKEHGAGALAGDKTAQNALAGFDPAAMQALQSGALGMDQTRLSMESTRQQMRILDEESARKAREEAAKLSADQRAQQLAGVERSIKMMSAYNDEASWDAAAAQLAPELVGQFGNKQSLIYSLMDAKDILSGAKPQSSQGKFYADQAAGLVPADATFKGDGETTIRVGGDTDKFLEKADGMLGERFEGYLAQGAEANVMLGNMQMLADLAPEVFSGATANIMASLGPTAQALGIEIEGLSATELFQSTVDRLAPQMRPAGSGAASDIDVKMFLSSLPKLSRTPAGNKLIADTMAALSAHQIRVAELAHEGIINPAKRREYEKQIRELPNPYAGMRKRIASVTTGSSGFEAIGGQAPVAPVAPVGNGTTSASARGKRSVPNARPAAPAAPADISDILSLYPEQK